MSTYFFQSTNLHLVPRSALKEVGDCLWEFVATNAIITAKFCQESKPRMLDLGRNS